MKTKIGAILAALLLALPLGALAASHEHGGSATTAEGRAMEHGDMMMGGMIMLEVQTEDGVQGMVHLKDVGEAMAKMGMKENFHFMVMFNDNSTGDPIVEGTAALKITDPAGKESEPLALMPMDDMFGADIALTAKGAYRFTVG
ncbi:MAG TPA: hypothetical protein VLR45_08830, partial [Desulfoprunum sp.]|nr:hypothetical protein [Desulfoprunum sp.]